MKCSACNCEINFEGPHFCGTHYPGGDKFGCAPHTYYCKDCMVKLPKYWPNIEDKKMKHFMPHTILKINRYFPVDPFFEELFRLVFEWANQTGLRGKRVTAVAIHPPQPEVGFTRSGEIYCQIECTEREYKQWRATMETNIIHNVHQACESDEGKNGE